MSNTSSPLKMSTVIPASHRSIAGLRKNMLSKHGADQHPQADHEEASPGAEVAAADERVERENSERADREHCSLSDQARLPATVDVEDG